MQLHRYMVYIIMYVSNVNILLKINKLRLNRVGRPEKGALVPCKESTAQQEKGSSSSLVRAQ